MIIKEIETKNILTKSNLPVSDFSVNPYVGCAHACKYCYASFMKRFTNHAETWGEFVDVKTWSPIKNTKRLAGKEVFISSVTDPYQPCEKKFQRTRIFLEQVANSDCRISIATKSALILRDLDLLKKFRDVRVSFSINTLDEKFRADMDSASSIEDRINAMKIIHEAWIRTTCFISPIFPGITDVKKIIQRTKDFCNLIWLENLNLRGDYRSRILDYIRANYPQLEKLYRDIYIRKDRTYWKNLDEDIRKFTAEENLEYVRNEDSQRSFELPPVVVNYFFHEELVK